MCNMPFSTRTTAMPVQTRPFWENPELTAIASLGRILHQVPDWPTRFLCASCAPPPVPNFIRHVQPIAFRHPPQHVIVRPPTLRQLDDPLIAESNALFRCSIADTPAVVADVLPAPDAVFRVRERNEGCGISDSSLVENMSS